MPSDFEKHLEEKTNDEKKGSQAVVIAAVILWNTVYLAATVEQLKRDGVIISDEHLQHISPLRWEHINLSGDLQRLH